MATSHRFRLVRSMYCVLAVPMEDSQVLASIILPITVAMLLLDLIAWFEVQSTVDASSLLTFYQQRYP